MISSLNSGFSNICNIEIRAVLSEFISIQFFRTPSGLRIIEDLNLLLNTQLKEKGWINKEWEEFHKNYNAKDQFNYGLVGLENKGAVIFNKIWVIWKAMYPSLPCFGEPKLSKLTPTRPKPGNILPFNNPMLKHGATEISHLRCFAAFEFWRSKSILGYLKILFRKVCVSFLNENKKTTTLASCGLRK